jgi:hypothetical protein
VLADSPGELHLLLLRRRLLDRLAGERVRVHLMGEEREERQDGESVEEKTHRIWHFFWQRFAPKSERKLVPPLRYTALPRKRPDATHANARDTQREHHRALHTTK